jgi:tRNA(Ile)-lysidine synthase
MVLLDLLAAFHSDGWADVQVLHVDHGLQAHASEWAGLVQDVASHYALKSHVFRVAVADEGRGLEEAARKARYQALEAHCLQHGLDALVLAHHANDQAETMLLQLLRGAGVAGLSGMPTWAADARPPRWRPLLEVSALTVRQYASARQLQFVEDPSNASRTFARNAIRLDVMPQLDAIRPAAVLAIGRSMQHLQEALALEAEIARADLSVLRHAGGLRISSLKTLSKPRRNATLREWMRLAGHESPSSALIEEIWRQVFDARASRSPNVCYGDWRFVRHGGILHLVRNIPKRATPDSVEWTGQDRWKPKSWNGEFRFVAAESGIRSDDLLGKTLVAQARKGGESLKIARNRPTRTLKQWYQSFDVPIWRRDSAPLLWLGDQLLFVPHVGMNCNLQLGSTAAVAKSGPEVLAISDTGQHWQIAWQEH